MTIAIGIDLGRYVMLAADTRTTYYSFLGRTFRDDSEKIQKTGIGLITGAGLLPLLDSVKRRLAKEEITDTGDIIRIVREEREKASVNFGPKVQEALRKTGWIFTYHTVLNGVPQLRLAVAHPELGNNIGLYGEKGPAIIYPIEANETQAKFISNSLLKEIRSNGEIAELQESIQYHARIIAILIKALHEHFPSVSDYCQVGVHTAEGRKGISPIIRGDERDVSFNLSRSSNANHSPEDIDDVMPIS
jgi:hypothetical protein